MFYVDNPWKFDAHSDKGLKRSPERHYPTIPLHELNAIAQVHDFKRILATDCTLYTWASSTYLRHAIANMEAWGFEYKSYVGWRKLLKGVGGTPEEMDALDPGNEHMGLGYHFRSTMELLLVGTRGAPGLPRKKFKNLISLPVGEHSEKPALFYDLIEAQHPGPYLEFWARERRQFWHQYGNDLPPL